jgi:hypothetical protein
VMCGCGWWWWFAKRDEDEMIIGLLVTLVWISPYLNFFVGVYEDVNEHF